MLETYDRLLHRVERLSRLFAWCGGVMLLAMVLLICTEIVMRRTVGHSLGLSFVITSYSIHYTKLYEIAAIGDACAEAGVALHMDGARFANALAE